MVNLASAARPFRARIACRRRQAGGTKRLPPVGQNPCKYRVSANPGESPSLSASSNVDAFAKFEARPRLIIFAKAQRTMSDNLDRLRKDFDRLLNLGKRLEYAMTREIQGKVAFEKTVKDQLKQQAADFLKNIPEFNKNYEAWYSESLALIRQLLPDRVDNFVSFYECRKPRKDINFGNYVIQDYLKGLRITREWDKEVIVDISAALPQYRQQLAILEATKARFDSSLFEIRKLVQADLFDSELEGARELLKHKFLRAAGAIAGVVLEKHLHQVCVDHSLSITKKNPGIGDINELLKANSVIDIPQWRHITFLADIRNLCDHNKQKEPTAEQIEDLISGTDKVLKTIS